MRNRTLTVVLVILICLAFAVTVMAAPAKSAKAKAKPAAKPAAKFDLDAALTKFWKLSDSAVVGTVDGASVTKGELTRALWFWNASSVLGDLLTAKMVEQAAKKQGVKLTQAELQAKEMEAVKRMNMKSVSELLKQFRVSKDRFVSSIRMSAYAEKAVKKSVKVSDAELSQYIRARHILIQFPANEPDQTKKEEAAKKKIDEIAAKLKAGEDFAKLAQEFSDDTSNKMQGGDLGWFTHGRMLPEFEKVAYDLKVGQISDPVKTVYGWHVIRLEGLGKDVKGKEKADLVKKITDDQIPMKMQAWFQGVQSKSKMDNKLAEPVVKEPSPVMRPQPPPRPTVRPTPAPPPNNTTPPPATNNDTPPPATNNDTTPPPPPSTPGN